MKLRQRTATCGRVLEDSGAISVELPGPIGYSARTALAACSGTVPDVLDTLAAWRSGQPTTAATERSARGV